MHTPLKRFELDKVRRRRWGGDAAWCAATAAAADDDGSDFGDADGDRILIGVDDTSMS